MGSQTMKASASQQGPLSAPVFSLGEPNKHLTGASGGKRARQREVPLPDEEVVTETQSEPDSGRIWQGSQDGEEPDEDLMKVKKAAEGLLQKRRKVAIRAQVKAIDGLCVKYVTKIEDMQRTMSKISSSNVSKVSKKMSALRKKLQAKSQELEGVQQAYQQDVSRIWTEYLALLDQKGAIKHEADGETQSQKQKCRTALDSLMAEVNSELDETEGKILKMKEESKKLPSDVTALIAQVLG
mmetsp:Transcript_40318/g.101431  ORF Transcript_40318/g.101431 Transcript_40318/m.101431 type:complete len:240 (-) Transcript_40318:126-845(-)